MSVADLDMLSAVARRTCALPYRIWAFGEGIALAGLLACSDVLADSSTEELVAALVKPFLHRDPEPDDHVASAETLVTLAHRLGDQVYLDGARRWARALLDAPRLVSGQPPTYRPDLFGLSTITWVDIMYTHGPGLAACGYHEAAVQLVEEASQCLQTDSGLYHHGYDVALRRTNNVAWGRGCGWALLGLVETTTHVQDVGLAERLGRLLTALARYEENGQWHTIVDDPDSPIENSVSAFVAAGILRGLLRGVVGRDFRDMGMRAFNATIRAVTDAALPVSEATPVGSARTYYTRRTGVFPWGQGPLLLALAAHRQLSQKEDLTP